MRMGARSASFALALVTAAQMTWAQEPTRPLKDLSVKTAPPAEQPRTELKTGDLGESGSFFTDWSVAGDSSWTSAAGFETTPSGWRKVTLSPSWLALGPAWQFNVRASSRGPGGIRFTGRAGGTAGQRLPASAVDFLDPNPAGPAFTQLDPATRQTIWSAGVGVDRTFRLGQVDLTLFGEALFVTGPLPIKNGPPPDGKKPLRTTAGMRLKF